MCYSFEECIINEATYYDVMMVMSTHQKIYFYHKSYNFWMCDNEDDNVKFLEEMDTGFPDPLPVSSEWKIYPRIATAEDPYASPAVELREKSTGGRGQATKLGKLLFKGYFSTYVGCQTFWQGCREARIRASGKTSQASIDDLI